MTRTLMVWILKSRRNFFPGVRRALKGEELSNTISKFFWPERVYISVTFLRSLWFLELLHCSIGCYLCLSRGCNQPNYIANWQELLLCHWIRSNCSHNIPTHLQVIVLWTIFLTKLLLFLDTRMPLNLKTSLQVGETVWLLTPSSTHTSKSLVDEMCS